MLKAVVFAALLVFAASAAAGATVATDLIVGSVRDRTGAPIEDAEVRALDGRGIATGAGRTGPDGTFALGLSAPAQRLEVRCRHCRTEQLSLSGSSNVVVVVQRYDALESDVPSPADLAALPYGRIGDALALVPFVVPSQSGFGVSDRNLAGGNGLVVDNGVPLVEFATGTSALVDFPDRYVQTVALGAPEDAFRYGNYAGGGVFALGPNAETQSYGAADVGGAPAVALEPSFGGLRSAVGESNDDGVLSRRADVSATIPFAGGVLNASTGSASEQFGESLGSDASARFDDLFHLGYATVSRRYRTFADFSAAEVSLFDDVAQKSDYDSSYLSAGVRVEHPGPVTLAFGALATQQTGYALAETTLTGRADDETMYVEARTQSEMVEATAGVALSDVSEVESLSSGRADGQTLALVPSLGVRLPVGASGLYLRGGYSEALRTPALLESNALPLAPSGALERDELQQAALGFDAGGRVRAEAIAYREDVQGFDERRQLGLGASFVWQVAPLVSVRTWTLRADPIDFTETYYPAPLTDTSRQLLWATYANGDGLRFDAIAHRDVHLPGGIVLDGDAYLPLTRFAALDLGVARTTGPRHYYVGLRTR